MLFRSGEITSAAQVPLAGGVQTVALGYIRREFAAPGTAVETGGAAATVSRVPFE